MKRLFETSAPMLAWIVLIALLAKLTALAIEAFLPPVALPRCHPAIAHAHPRLAIARAFGLKNPVTRPTPSPQKHPRPINLSGYKLTMTAVGHPSMAMILKGRKAKLLSVGETIDGFRLEKVYTDRVQLRKNGRTYWLTMKKSAQNARLGHIVERRKKVPTEALEEQIRQEGDTYYIPRELLAQMHDLRKIFKYIAIKPIYRNNKVIGFGISRIVRGSVFDKMGLRKRDIIEKVNGRPITSEADGFKYFNKFDELSSLTLTIRRGKERKELHYEIF